MIPGISTGGGGISGGGVSGTESTDTGNKSIGVSTGGINFGSMPLKTEQILMYGSLALIGYIIFKKVK